MHVVATAGHVDHGKSTLVRALTGTDPDRLEEEHRRGLTIELGYAWTTLDGPGEVAFVDVPGHERFVATMLAGVGPVPVVMFVVAADDPWMPQAAEHLAALDALGVTDGVLVVTRADLADPGPALARAREELAPTSLAGVPAVTVSGRTGAGLDELRATLAATLAGLPAPDPDADVRLWVDRSFHVRGSGTVVTGTLPAGSIAAGDTLAAGEEQVRVRGLESLGTPRERVGGVARVALDLGGHAPEAVARGGALTTPGGFTVTTTVDVRVSGPGTLPRRPLLHIGSARVATHARPLGESFVRLRLERPLPLHVGDRALLRDPGSRTVWGVRVLDPLPPPLERRGAATARARLLGEDDGSLAAALRARGVVRRSTLRRLGLPSEPLPEGTVCAGDWLVAPDAVPGLREALVARVRGATTDLEPGLSIAAAAQALGLPDPELVGALVAPPLALDRGRVVEDREHDLPPPLREALEALRDRMADAPFAAPDAHTLRDLGLDARTIGALHRTGHVLRVGDGVVLLPGADDLAARRLAELPQPFTTSQARQALGTSRRVALPLLAHLDRTGRTLRMPDDTRRLRSG